MGGFITINTMMADVALDLGGRTDLTTGNPPRAAKWIRNAYWDLAMAIPFEELETSIPDAFVQGIDTYVYPASARAIKTLSFTTSDGSSQPIKRKNIQVVRRYASTSLPGPPSIYAPYNRNIIVRPVPDHQYTFTWDVWVLPTITSNIIDTQIQLPNDWLIIVQLLADMYGHIALLERDKAGELRQLLYGDPKNASNPGLIKSKLTLQSAESYDSDYAIAPRVRPYASTR